MIESTQRQPMIDFDAGTVHAKALLMVTSSDPTDGFTQVETIGEMNAGATDAEVIEQVSEASEGRAWTLGPHCSIMRLDSAMTEQVFRFACGQPSIVVAVERGRWPRPDRSS